MAAAQRGSSSTAAATKAAKPAALPPPLPPPPGPPPPPPVAGLKYAKQPRVTSSSMVNMASPFLGGTESDAGSSCKPAPPPPTAGSSGSRAPPPPPPPPPALLASAAAAAARQSIASSGGASMLHRAPPQRQVSTPDAVTPDPPKPSKPTNKLHWNKVPAYAAKGSVWSEVTPLKVRACPQERMRRWEQRSMLLTVHAGRTVQSLHALCTLHLPSIWL